MKIGTRHIATVTMFLAAAFACGCASSGLSHEEQCLEPKAGTITSVNTRCVIVGSHPVDPAVTPIAYKGQKIGFCCDHCIPTFNKMKDTEKDAAIAKAIASK